MSIIFTGAGCKNNPDNMVVHKIKNIILFGMMGSGKSTLGPGLAKSLGFSFFDMDQEIEMDYGKSINAIFAEKGETFFRELELKTAQKLVQKKDAVIAAGGGAFENLKTRLILCKNGFPILLNGDPKILFQRVAMNPGNRPLLQTSNPEKSFLEIYRRRQKDFHKIKNILNVTESNNIELLVSKLKAMYLTQKYCCEN
ncbi:shikimate kinase [Candidatus Riflebacteria bacterium]